MGKIVQLQGLIDESNNQQPAPAEPELVARFRRFWKQADPEVKVGIKAIVEGVELNDINAQAREVLEYLNTKRLQLMGGRGFSPTAANLRHVRARLADGYTVAELRAVAAIKFRECQSDEFNPRYYRPETLYNPTKFDQYVADLPIIESGVERDG